MPEPYHSNHDQYLENYRRTGNTAIIGQGRKVFGRRKDGTVFPMELNVREFQLGEKKLFAGAVRDITDQEGINDELRLVRRCVENTNDAVVIMGPDLEEPGPKIEYINSAFTRMTGTGPMR